MLAWANREREERGKTMPVIDVHTHMLNRQWLELLRRHGKPRYAVQKSMDAPEGIFLDGAPFMTPQEGHFDYEARIRAMDAARVDIAILSLTCPNVYWGGAEVSHEAARIVNDDMARAEKAYPGRIRWMASLPWQYPDLAVAELRRACDRGAVGVMVLANIDGRSLTDPLFAPVWQEIDRRALPVLVHPTAPPGTPEMDLRAYNLIASHAGAALPYLAGRLDICFENMNACRTRTETPPRDYLRHIYYDSVTYRPEALALCIDVGGADHVMYGSDYPHNIGDMKGCLARVDALPALQGDAVRGGNAQRIFRL